MPLEAKTRLGPYEILAPIGAGGMGEVYKARDTRLRRDVAVKVLAAEFAGDSERLKRFEEEARSAAALNHPNIMVLHDFGTHEGTPYFVTELLEGESLRQRLQAGAMTPAKAVEVGVQIAHGLAAAHEKGIVHRDLKPENLFVTKDGRVKILDFGLARLRPPLDDLAAHSQATTMDTPTREGKVVGTPGYMAPEQVRGLPADARSDIFGLGCVLYEMLSGRRPFERGSTIETMSAILQEDPPDLVRPGALLPPGLVRIVGHCLEKSPDARFQSARDVAFDLEILSGASGVISGVGAATPAAPGRRVPGRRALTLGVPAAVLALAAAGAAGVLLHRAVTSPSQPIFRQLTFRRGEIGWAARFSPDGKEIYYSALWDGKASETFCVRPGSPESRPLGFGTSILWGVFPNGDLLIADEADALAVAPVNGGVPRKILERVFWPDAGPDPQHICVVQVESGIRRLEYPLGKVLYQTSRGLTLPRLSHKGDRVAFFLEDSVWVVDLAGKAKCLVKWEGELWSFPCWSPSDDEVWFTGRKEGAGWSLNAVTLGGRLRRVYAGPGRLLLEDISVDGKVLLVRASCRYGFVVGDTKTGTEQELSWLDGSNFGPLSWDGSKILFFENVEATSGRPILYMRGTDGSPPVKLGEGYPWDLSRDGRWVLAVGFGEKCPQLHLIPTGAGQPKALTSDRLNHLGGFWMPDGKSFVFRGNEPGKKPRFWIQSVAGGPPKALTGEGDYFGLWALSPDGRHLAYWDKDKEGIFVISTDGGNPRPVPLREPRAGRPIQFSSDGQALYLYSGLRRAISRVHIETGQTTLVREIKPADPAGLRGQGAMITPDGKTYVFGYYRQLADLFLVEGLK